MNLLKIPAPEYREMARKFNPVKLDAEAVVRLAKAAGMRYLEKKAKPQLKELLTDYGPIRLVWLDRRIFTTGQAQGFVDLVRGAQSACLINGRVGNNVRNIGPRGDGSVPVACVAILGKVGGGMQKNRERIHRAKASAFPRALPLPHAPARPAGRPAPSSLPQETRKARSDPRRPPSGISVSRSIPECWGSAPPASRNSCCARRGNPVRM